MTGSRLRRRPSPPSSLSLPSPVVAVAQTTGATVVRDPQVIDTCTGTTDFNGYISCDVPTGDEIGEPLTGYLIALVDPVLVGPEGGLRNLPSANIYVRSIDQATGSVLLRIIGTEVVFWPHDGHWGPIPYRTGPVTLRLVVFYSED